MNRRGFLGSIAGAFVGGVFRRLAPVAPIAPAAVRGLSIVDYTEALKRIYTPEIVASLMGYRKNPLLEAIERRAVQRIAPAGGLSPCDRYVARVSFPGKVGKGS